MNRNKNTQHGKGAGRKGWIRGFSLVEIMVTVGAMGAFMGTGVVMVINAKERSEAIRLEHDVKTLNRAVSIYLSGGGSLGNLAGAEDVLAKLKTVASREGNHYRQLMIPREGILDARSRAVTTPATEGQKVAVWDAGSRRFEIREGVRGVVRFDFDRTGEMQAPLAEKRQAVFKLAKQNGWVWDHEPAESASEVTPPDVGDIDPTKPSPGLEIPIPPETLLAPRFSKPPGRYPLRDFPAVVEIVNPNPAGVALVFWSGGPDWQRYENVLTLHPTASTEAYAASLDPSKWNDSPMAAGAWEAEPVGPVLEWRFPKSRYTYAELGGEMMPGDYPPPPPLAAGRLALANAEEIPLDYQDSTYFRPYWTTDGSDPASSGTRQTGGSFSHGYVEPTLMPGLSLWGNAAEASLRPMAVSHRPQYFHDHAGVAATLSAEAVPLRAPLASPEPGAVKIRGNADVALALNPDFGDMPLGARLYYTTDGADPGDMDGDPAGGSAYAGELKAPFINGPWTVSARTYAPEDKKVWFQTSPLMQHEFQVCSEIPQRGTASGLALGVDLSLLNLLHVPVHVGAASGVAPNPFSRNSGLLSAAVNAGLNTGLVNVNVISVAGIAEADAESDVKTAPTESGAQSIGSSSLATAGAGVSIRIGTITLLSLIGPGITLPPVLEIRARTLGGEAMVAGEPGDLAVTGRAVLADAAVFINGSQVLNLPANPAPNTGIDLSVLGLAGASLLLNEQHISRSEGSASIDTCALAIRLNALNLGIANTLSGQVRVGHASAALRGTVCE